MLMIRADASPEIGSGHLMRCLALAQAWQEHGRSVVFATAECGPGLLTRLRREGFGVRQLSLQPGSDEDMETLCGVGREIGASWVVLDGYRFGSRYQRSLKDAGFRVVAMDDYGHAEHYCADVVVNQNISAKDGTYAHREAYTRLLLGTEYALLRLEFLRWRLWQRSIPERARRFLVSLGGADAQNATRTVIRALREDGFEDVQARVVVGDHNCHLESLRQEVDQARCQIQLLSSVSDMGSLMAWADLAVSGSGSTAWELAFMGLPAVTLVIAENQQAVAQGLEEAVLSVNLGWDQGLATDRLAQVLRELSDDARRRTEISQRGRALIDGRGAERILGHLDAARAA